MSQPKLRVFVILVVLFTLVIRTATLTAFPQKQNVPKPQDKLSFGDEHIRALLPLIDTDKNGKVSKQEFMRFMEAEFDRLDKDKTGKLDVKELTQSKLNASQTAKVGK